MEAATVRKSFFAGSFYPAKAQEIRRILDTLRLKAGDQSKEAHPPILIVPHAGWVYSGLAAVRGIQTLAGKPLHRVVMIGPSHRHYFLGFSMAGYEKYETPLGVIDGDLKLQAELSDVTGYGFEQEAHDREHSLEVILPMLQHLIQPGFKVLMIQTGNVSRSDCEKLADGLAAVLNPLTDTLLVSTDLSHFFPYEHARELDAETISYILNGDTAALMERSGEGGRLMCGFTGVIVAIDLARKWGLGKPGILMYYNSGDSGGDSDSVVGYVSMTYPPAILEMESQGAS